MDLFSLHSETPISSYSPSVTALNKIRWDKEGRRIAVGSSDGTVYIHDVGKLAMPRDGDIELVRRSIEGFESVVI